MRGLGAEGQGREAVYARAGGADPVEKLPLGRSGQGGRTARERAEKTADSWVGEGPSMGVESLVCVCR